MRVSPPSRPPGSRPVPNPSPSSHHYRIVFAERGDAVCVPIGIDFVRRALTECRDEVHPTGADSAPPDADALLVAGELLANAHNHAGGPCSLDLDCAQGRLRIQVTDRSPERPHPVLPHRAERIGGHGLYIVDRLSASWGSTPASGGKTVWAELSAFTGSERG